MDRPELVCLVKEALLRNRLFRPHRKDWAVHRADDERREQSIARAIVDHLQRCGVRWSKKPPAGLHGRLE